MPTTSKSFLNEGLRRSLRRKPPKTVENADTVQEAQETQDAALEKKTQKKPAATARNPKPAPKKAEVNKKSASAPGGQAKAQDREISGESETSQEKATSTKTGSTRAKTTKKRTVSKSSSKTSTKKED